MNAKSHKTCIRTIDDLLAHAIAIEREAVERYNDLAEQMSMHHNHETAEFFRKMAKIESLHVDRLDEVVADQTLPHFAPWEFSWTGAESPESIEMHESELDYRTTPYHAIRMALAAEERAAAFYARIAADAPSDELRELAERFAEEEHEHVRLLAERLGRYAPPAADTGDDPDPATTGE